MDAEAHFLRSSQLLAFARLRMGTPGPLPRPTSDLSEIPPHIRRQVDHALSVSVTGSPRAAKERLNELVSRYAPDEIIFSGAIHDPEKRVRSFELLAEVAESA